jgi:hypothetical protein
MSAEILDVVIYSVILGSLVGFLLWFFARYVVGRRRINSGLRALGIVNVEYLSSADRTRAVQEIMYTQEVWQEKHEDGDPPER